jgi:RHS repeat-associated protein
MVSGPYWAGGTPAQQLAFAYHGPLLRAQHFIGTVGGSGTEVSWGYDQRHLLQTESVSSEPAITFAYDADDLLTASGELSIARVPATGDVYCVWNASGGNTVREWRQFDATYGELSSIEYRHYPTLGTPADNCSTAACTPGSPAPCAASAAPGDQLLRLEYVRDDLGRIVQKNETVNGGAPGVYEYSYDEVGRLIGVTKDAVAIEHYEYDKNGNRLVAQYGTAAPVEATYDDQDRLLTHDVWTDIQYTPNGALEARLDAQGNGVELEYDPFGSLISATVDGSTTSNVYDTDARGRRLQTRYGGSMVGRWIWRSQLQPVAELDSTNAVLAQYVYSDGVNVPDLVMAGADRWRLIKDHLGSVRMVVDVATGTVLRSLEYDAFGRVIAESGNPDVVPFGFAGGMWDSDTRLVRFGARDYDPETGRWTAKDPIRFAGGDTNIYAYCGSDPVNRIDPRGLNFIDDALAALREADELHRSRNRWNRCPARRPRPGNTCDESVEGDEDPEGRVWEHSVGKWRGSDGSECLYDENGDLEPNSGESYNYCPDPWTACHIFADVYPHFLFGGSYGSY